MPVQSRWIKKSPKELPVVITAKYKIQGTLWYIYPSIHLFSNTLVTSGVRKSAGVYLQLMLQARGGVHPGKGLDIFICFEKVLAFYSTGMLVFLYLPHFVLGFFKTFSHKVNILECGYHALLVAGYHGIKRADVGLPRQSMLRPDRFIIRSEIWTHTSCTKCREIFARNI